MEPIHLFVAMRIHFVRVLAVVGLPISVATSQTASVSGQIVLKEGGQPLGYTTVSVLSQQNIQLLTSESGKFLLRALNPGAIKLRFKRIGFAPKDTTVNVAADQAAEIRIEMTRLVISLPAMLVSGKCTDRSPLESRPEILDALFDQIHQNAERVRLLAKQRDFYLQVFRMRGYENRSGKTIPTQVDTVVRRPMPPGPYQPKQVIRRGEREEAGNWVMALPELPDFADTAFTNNHCLRYAGQTRYKNDSVIKVEFEPVPWLNKEVDIEGTMYLKVPGYQLVGTITKLNKVPPQFRSSGMTELMVTATFSEIVEGVPVLDQWELISRYRYPNVNRLEVGQVFGVKWADSVAVKKDTIPARR